MFFNVRLFELFKRHDIIQSQAGEDDKAFHERGFRGYMKKETLYENQGVEKGDVENRSKVCKKGEVEKHSNGGMSKLVRPHAMEEA